MSWSVDYTGAPAAVQAALDKQSTVLTGASKEEFDAALPGLKVLVGLNQNDKYPCAIRLTAAGHAHGAPGERYSSCTVKIESAGQVVT